MKIEIVSGGELAERLAGLLVDTDTVQLIGVQIRRRYGLAYLLRDPAQAASQLQHTDIIINLLPTGQDFAACGIIDLIPQSATVIDFSRPPISPSCGRKIIMGNRLYHPSIRIWPPLPGWRPDELPACSLPCLLASQGDLSVVRNDHDFNIIARYMGFSAKITRGDSNA